MAKERPQLTCRCSAPGQPELCLDKCDRLCAKIRPPVGDFTRWKGVFEPFEAPGWQTDFDEDSP